MGSCDEQGNVTTLNRRRMRKRGGERKGIDIDDVLRVDEGRRERGLKR